jgi:trigger factor
MTATVEILDGLNRRLTLNVNHADIEAEVSKRLAKVARTVRMDGFRPGQGAEESGCRALFRRNPQRGVRRCPATGIQRSAIQATTLHVAGYPRFAPAEGGGFNATFEVFPQVKLGDLGQIKVTRPVVEATDADVDRTLEVLRKQRVQFHAVDRAAQQGDRVHVDYVGLIDGNAFPGGEAKDFPVVLGEGRTLKEFEGSLSGMSVGENKSIRRDFPG